MKKKYEEQYHEEEQEHFWFKSRRNLIVDMIKDANKNHSILDIGCSSGVLIEKLINCGFKSENIYGIDISESAIQKCHERGLKNTCVMDAHHIDLGRKFDIIIASDCLEHLNDDRSALDNWYSILNPEGIAYVFVPAFPSIWSNHDVINMHYRRYIRSELKEKMSAANFKVIRSGYWNFSLFFPIYMTRKLSNILGKSEQKTSDLETLPSMNTLFGKILSIENYFLRFINFPVGVSTFCIGRKI